GRRSAAHDAHRRLHPPDGPVPLRPTAGITTRWTWSRRRAVARLVAYALPRAHGSDRLGPPDGGGRLRVFGLAAGILPAHRRLPGAGPGRGADADRAAGVPGPAR